MQTANSIEQKTVENLGSLHAKTSWVKDNRLIAWEAYLKTPMPSVRSDAWRRTLVETLDLSNLRTVEFEAITQKTETMPDCFKSAIECFEKPAGLIYQQTNQPGYLYLSEEAKAKGVIFCDICTALNEHAELLQPYLSMPITEGFDDKFTLLNKSLYNCGLLLYVPAGVQLEAPFVSGLNFDQHSQDGLGTAIFPRINVIAGANSKVNLVHIINSKQTSKQENASTSLVAGLVEVKAEAGADVSYLEVQQTGANVFYIGKTHNEVQKDARFTSMSVASGGKQTKVEIVTLLQAPGAASEVLGVVFGKGKEHFSFDTIQEHNAPDTTSDINFRVALSDEAASVYQGSIKVAKTAQRTNAYQSNKNLLLGAKAKADSIPRLEILTDDVKCSHGATVGPVDKEQIFYLMSRGLNRVEAEELVVFGFFRKVMEKLTIEGAHELLEQIISKQITGQTATKAESCT